MFNLIPLPYRIAAAVFLLIAVFGIGYMKGSSRADVIIAEAGAKASEQIAELERKNSEISNAVVTKYVDKVRVVKEREYVYLGQAQTNVPNQFNLSNGWVYLHDFGAKGSDAEAARASDATASSVRDNTALGVVLRNYSACTENSGQIEALQKWIRDMETEVDKSNNN
jgi:hypothetical protein